MNITDIYTSMLKFSGLEVNDQGVISTRMKDHKEPVMVNGLKMILPLYENLKHFNPKEEAIFHPLAENIVRDESAVLKKFRDVINIRLNYTIGVTVQHLLNLVASPDLHKQLNPEQMQLLTCIKDCDNKTVTNFIQQMISAIRSSPDTAFINIFLKRGGYKAKQKHARLAVVTFPFYKGINDMKVRQKDKEAFKQIFQYLFPEIEDKEAYYYGSDSNIAPFLDAMMHAAALIASPLNDTLELFKDYIEDADDLIFEGEWLEYFQNLDDLLNEIRKIPTHVIDDYVQPTVQTPPPPPPVMQPPQQPMLPGYPINPVLQQPAMVQPGELEKTDRGLSFRSMVMNNPSIASVPNALGHVGYQPQYRPEPSWAQPQPQYQQPGYPPQQGYPQQPAWAPPQPQYQQPGYPPQQGYPQQPAWAPPQPQYPQQGYPQQPSGYPAYPQQPLAYPQPAPFR